MTVPATITIITMHRKCSQVNGFATPLGAHLEYLWGPLPTSTTPRPSSQTPTVKYEALQSLNICKWICKHLQPPVETLILPKYTHTNRFRKVQVYLFCYHLLRLVCVWAGGNSEGVVGKSKEASERPWKGSFLGFFPCWGWGWLAEVGIDKEPPETACIYSERVLSYRSWAHSVAI